jgi:hypothetical protein
MGVKLGDVLRVFEDGVLRKLFGVIERNCHDAEKIV